jgi:hypothetical protein
MWLKAPESIILEKGIQLRVVYAMFTGDPTVFSLAKRD